MGFVANVNALRDKHPLIWQRLNGIENWSPRGTVLNEQARTGEPTLALERQGTIAFIHSKYDPRKEAERFVEQFDPAEVGNYRYVFFYGIGLGYHVEAFLGRFPEFSFILYEPEPAVFYQYMCLGSLDKLPLRNLKQVFVERFASDTGKFAGEFLAAVAGEVLFVVLPSYQQLFSEAYTSFTQNFRQAIKNKRSSLHTNLGFQKRWIINSLLNFPEVVATPNMLHDLDAHGLKNKPAILVAAGPALDEEIEHLRQIKDDGLAYIFSVGSAINALLEEDIYPDAACSYDPTEVNQRVFQKIGQMGVTSIPLIFGSSIGFETLRKYPGPKLHMITSQDTVGAYFLSRKDGQAIKKVSDAPSIAVLTLNMLLELGFNPVVLVGQNLAYQKGRFYASGIQYAQAPGEINEEEQKKLIEIEDVYGEKAYTTDGFLKAKNQMEQYIAVYEKIKDIRVINTTKGGARIKGADFLALEDVIKEHLPERGLVDEGRLQAGNDNKYDQEYTQDKFKVMNDEIKELQKIIEELYGHLRRMQRLVEYNESSQMGKAFEKWDKAFKKMGKNDAYQVFLQPMNRVQYDLLVRAVSAVRFDKDVNRKAQVVITEFGKFIQVCQQDLQAVMQIFPQVSRKLDFPNEEGTLPV